MVQITLKEVSLSLTLSPEDIRLAILERANQAAEKHGYQVRQEGIEWPGGNRTYYYFESQEEANQYWKDNPP